MKTGVTKLFVSFVLLLLFHALLVMSRESPLAELVRGWVPEALLLCGLGGFALGVYGVTDLSGFLESSRHSDDKQQCRIAAD